MKKPYFELEARRVLQDHKDGYETAYGAWMEGVIARIKLERTIRRFFNSIIIKI